MGFTGHYAATQEKFGVHLVHGCAGENILVAVDKIMRMEEFGDSL
jgi:hypothetical protein